MPGVEGLCTDRGHPDSSELQGNAFLLVMEYLAGGSLSAALQHDDSPLRWWIHRDGRHRTGQGFSIAVQLADALAYLHANEVRPAALLPALLQHNIACRIWKVAELGILHPHLPAIADRRCVQLFCRSFVKSHRVGMHHAALLMAASTS